MSDSQQLLLVVAVIYLSECSLWTPLYSIGFLTSGGGRWIWSQPGKWFGNRRHGLFVKPLLPISTCYLCQFWPTSISPDGVLSEVFYAFSLPFRPEQPLRYVRFEELQDVRAIEKDVHVNGRVFCRTGSPRSAAHLAELIHTCRSLPTEKRAETIQRALHAAFDLDALRTSLADFGERQSAVRALGMATFVLVFVVCPLVVYQFGWPRTWVCLLVALITCVLSTVVLFCRAHGALYPGNPHARWLHAALMLMNPLAAIRVHDALSQELLALFHPLAVAHALFERARYCEFARQMLRDVRHPLQPVCELQTSEAIATEAWFRQRNLDVIEAFLRSTNIDTATLLAGEAPSDETSRSYCPRCRGQYVLESGTCAACGGIRWCDFRFNSACDYSI